MVRREKKKKKESREENWKAKVMSSLSGNGLYQ